MCSPNTAPWIAPVPWCDHSSTVTRQCQENRPYSLVSGNWHSPALINLRHRRFISASRALSRVLVTFRDHKSQWNSPAINVPERGLRKTYRILYELGHGSKRWSSPRCSWLAWMRACCSCLAREEDSMAPISLWRLTKGCLNDGAFRIISLFSRCLNRVLFSCVCDWLANLMKYIDPCYWPLAQTAFASRIAASIVHLGVQHGWLESWSTSSSPGLWYSVSVCRRVVDHCVYKTVAWLDSSIQPVCVAGSQQPAPLRTVLAHLGRRKEAQQNATYHNRNQGFHES